MTIGLDVALLAIAVGVGAACASGGIRLAPLRERGGPRPRRTRRLGTPSGCGRRNANSIAREMHDVLAHRISLVSLHAGALEIRPDLSSDEVARAAGTIRASAHQALEDLREILGVLRAGSDGAGAAARAWPNWTSSSPTAGPPARAVEVDDRLPDAPRAAVGEPHGVPPGPGGPDQRAQARARRAGAPAPRPHRRRRAARLAAQRAWPARASRRIPGARAGLVGLAERVSLAGGRLDHGVRRGADGTARLPPGSLAAMADVIRVLIVDDDPLVRVGLSLVLGRGAGHRGGGRGGRRRRRRWRRHGGCGPTSCSWTSGCPAWTGWPPPRRSRVRPATDRRSSC